jgi:hypothetical protein
MSDALLVIVFSQILIVRNVFLARKAFHKIGGHMLTLKICRPERTGQTCHPNRSEQSSKMLKIKLNFNIG